VFSFEKKIDTNYYSWLTKINRIFYDFFMTEHTNKPDNRNLIKKEKVVDCDDLCTFFIYDKEFISYRK